MFTASASSCVVHAGHKTELPFFGFMVLQDNDIVKWLVGWLVGGNAQQIVLHLKTFLSLAIVVSSYGIPSNISY